MALAKSIASICEEKDNGTYFTDVSCESLWKDLKLGQPRGDTMYYFIFDGVEKLSKMHADAGTQFFDVLQEASHSSATESDGTGFGFWLVAVVTQSRYSEGSNHQQST